MDIPTIKSISDTGRLSGTHKYDVWIANEIRKNKKLSNKQRDFQYIIDWARKKHPNISSIGFVEALKLTKEWHKEEFETGKKNKNIKENVEDIRIIYRCKDKSHYFLLLKPEELLREGDMMHHCVGSYKSKLSSGSCLIVSLRDEKNVPHVTVEVDTYSGRVVQIRGNSNQNPAIKYLKMVHEFALYATGYGDKVDSELVSLMNTQFEQ